MSQNIYPIQLLNDLHNYFPDILYNPGRFRNIQDLLEYIRSVADVNPFTRGLRLYQQSLASRLRSNNLTNVTSMPNPAVRSNTNTTSNIPYTRIEVPLGSESSLISALFGTQIGELINNLANTPDVITLQGLQTFLDQRVPVTPSIDQINRASVVDTVNENINEICTICQDQIEIGQERRRINYCRHPFHKDCIDIWFTRNVQCPTCRHDIRENNLPSAP